MSNLVLTLWGIVLIVSILGGIPYLVWVIYTAFNRRWKRLGWQLGIPLVAFLLLVALSSVLNAAEYRKYLTSLYDAKVDLGKPIFAYDSKRDLNGDGYSFSVYPLPASVRKRFESPDGRLLSEFPKLPEYRSEWKPAHWREAPIDGTLDKFSKFALSGFFPDREPSLQPYFTAIRNALGRKGTFYAFFHEESEDHVENIDFFVVDLVEGRIYSINHNT